MILRMSQNISWKSKTNNEKLYNDLPKVTDIISERMLNLAGHCVRHKEEMAHNLVLYEEREEEDVSSLHL